MIVDKKDYVTDTVTVDLSGPEGNAFALLGLAKSFCKVNNFDKETTDAIISEMTSSDYDNLVEVMDNYFGSKIIFLK